MKQLKIKFSISVEYVYEVEVDVIPMDICGVVFVFPYMYTMVVILMGISNQYLFIKDKKSFMINVHKVKSIISMASTNKGKILIR